MYYEERKEVVAEAPVVEAPVEPWRQHLLGAAQVLRDRGWTQRFAVHPLSNAVCAAQAIRMAVGSSESGFPYHLAIGKFVGFTGCPTVPGWNDQPGRTAEQVIAALEGAARS